jgi:hypothetical protein
MPHYSDRIFSINDVTSGSVTLNKIKQIAPGSLLGRISSGSGSIEEVRVVSIDDLPYGSIINRKMTSYVIDTPEKVNDWNLIYNNYYRRYGTIKCITVPSTALALSQSIQQTINATKTREALSYNGTTWQVYAGSSTFIEESTDGSSFTSIEPYKFNYNNSLNRENYHCDFAGGRVVIGILNNCSSYVYSSNGTSFTKVDTNMNLMSPFISGTVFSFLNVTTNQRVYTTDHVNFLTSSNAPASTIHRMSNGTLYAGSGTAVKMSFNNGTSWTDYTMPGTIVNPSEHFLDRGGSTYIFCGASNGMWMSTNLSSWAFVESNITGNTNLHAIYYVNSVWFVFSAVAATRSFSVSTNGTTFTNVSWNGATLSLVGRSVIHIGAYIILCSNSIQQLNLPTSGTTSTKVSGVGSSQTDKDSRLFYGPGTKGCFLNDSTSTWYFFTNVATTTIPSSQGLSVINILSLGQNLDQLIKVT